MGDLLSDGTISWIGGLDTSRSPADIAEVQYAKGNNIIIPNSLGGIAVRFGIHCCSLRFESKETEAIYRDNAILAEGYFLHGNTVYLLCLVNGYVMRFTKITAKGFLVENLNPYNQNADTTATGWITTIPGGCVVNNGFDYPLIVTADTVRRADPSKGDIGIGRMGVYLQHRLFYVDQGARQILASDFNQPTKFTLEGTGILGFMCPDADERVVAIGKQKSMLGTVEGGNLIWSSSSDLYSTDVRGSRSEWASLGSKVGKVSETVPNVAAASSYSFEAFNTNIYFRSIQLGMADLKQSESQFINLDSMNSQSVEASYYFDNDTDWMLDRCYTRGCNKRLFTTVAPEKNSEGQVYWNGILSFFPASAYANQGSIPRRFESVFTGVRPWCLTTVKSNERDQLFIHSFDADGSNRLYVMDENSNHDINHLGDIKEISGFLETKYYTHNNPLLLKSPEHRFYRMNLMDRSVKIKLFSRPEVNGPWTLFSENEHLVCRTRVENGLFIPESNKGQTRPYVNLPNEKFDCCYRMGTKFMGIQYRIEFTGPFNFDSIVVIASLSDRDRTISKPETECITLIYSYHPDYDYSITTTL